MLAPGAIFYRLRQGKRGTAATPYFRVAGCTCGKGGGRKNHSTLAEAERCGKRAKARAEAA